MFYVICFQGNFDLRWPEPIDFARWLFLNQVFGRNDLTDFYDFWHPLYFKKMLFIFL